MTDYVKQNKAFLIYGTLVILFLVAIGIQQNNASQRNATKKTTPRVSHTTSKSVSKITPTATSSATPTVTSRSLFQREPSPTFVFTASSGARLR